MGTDCSGMAVPELAMVALAQRQGAQVSLKFACDIAAHCRDWLRHQGIEVILADMVARVFDPAEKQIVGRDLAGQPHTIYGGQP